MSEAGGMLRIMGFHLAAAAEAVGAHRLRSALTMLGIAFGVAAFVAVTVLGTGFHAKVDGELSTLGTHLIIVQPRVAKNDHRENRSVPKTLTIHDATLIAHDIPGVARTAPVVLDSREVRYHQASDNLQILGSTEDFTTALDLRLLKGRLFDASEAASSAKVVVLGARVGRFLFSGDLEAGIGESVFVNNVPLKVVGILRDAGNAGGFDVDNMAILPLRTAKERVLGAPVDAPGSLQSMVVYADRLFDKDQIRSEVAALLRETHRIARQDPPDFTISDLAASANAQKNIMNAVTLVMTAVAVISLAIGGVGIMNMMLVSVTERTREIGLRMAIGAKRWEIITQFLAEACLLTSLGGIAGIVAGLGAGKPACGIFGYAFIVEPSSVGLAFAIASATGVLFGFYPALKAARLTPIDALRHD
jgi:putative ABC transport system permease protein